MRKPRTGHSAIRLSRVQASKNRSFALGEKALRRWHCGATLRARAIWSPVGVDVQNTHVGVCRTLSTQRNTPLPSTAKHVEVEEIPG